MVQQTNYQVHKLKKFKKKQKTRNHKNRRAAANQQYAIATHLEIGARE